MVVTDPGDLLHRRDHSEDIRGMGHRNEPGGRNDNLFERGKVKRVIRTDPDHIELHPLFFEVSPWEEI